MLDVITITDEQRNNHITRRGYSLNYLYEITFADGSVFKQTQDDMSNKYPCKRCVLGEQDDCEGKNQYTDVLESGREIIKCSLIGKGNIVTVDLQSGLFYINGLPVILEGEKRLPCLPRPNKGEKFELVRYYWAIQQQTRTYDKSTGEVIKKEEHPEHREFYIGWKCNIAGKSYQQKIGVA